MRGIPLFLAGAACLAIVLGYLVGASNSPVVATALPLLFAVIGGAGGFHVLRSDPAQPAFHEQLRLFGGLLLAFSVSFFAGLNYGIAVRSDEGVAALSPRNVSKPLTHLDDPAERRQFILLRAKLRMLGATEAEIERLAALMANEARAARDGESIRGDIAALAADLAPLSVATRAAFGSADLEEAPPYFFSLDTTLNEGLGAHLAMLAAAWANGEHVERYDGEILEARLERLRAALEDPDVILYLRLLEVPIEDLFVFELRLTALHHRLRAADAGWPASERIDEFLSQMGETERVALSARNPGRGVASVD